MSQNLQNFVRFQKFQLENLVDFEKCCKTHIYLQKSVPIQPKTSNIGPPRSAQIRGVRRLTSIEEPGAHRGARTGLPELLLQVVRSRAPRARITPFENQIFKISKMHFSKILQIFGGLVLGCIKTKFCKNICVRQHFQALQDLHPFAPLQSQSFSKKSV